MIRGSVCTHCKEENLGKIRKRGQPVDKQANCSLVGCAH